ncbi:MAG TPA: hypothetical protein VFO57_06880 [Burkholderiales bacterium]|nr:hypothetical protein [Burkholderiales bacterium]
MRPLLRCLLAPAALLLPLAGAAADGAAAFGNLVQSRYVHCAFYRAYEVDRTTGDLLLVEGRSNSLTHFQAIRDGNARQISTRVAGARNVRVMNSGKYLHFVDEVAGMYVLTTIYDCLDRDPKSGTCISYGATQSRHFDPRVLTDPDAVYEALKEISDPGFCDHSFIGMQEASRGN